MCELVVMLTMGVFKIIRLLLCVKGNRFLYTCKLLLLRVEGFGSFAMGYFVQCSSRLYFKGT
jgi:hypothetical protein